MPGPRIGGWLSPPGIAWTCPRPSTSGCWLRRWLTWPEGVRPAQRRARARDEMMEAEATVFVVDDDADLRESLGWLLESAGLRVKSYSTAQEFLTDYKSEEAGCLLLDVRMPGLSGLDLQEELRRRGVPPPIIIMTGHARVPMAVRALNGGVMEKRKVDSVAELVRLHLLWKVNGAAGVDSE